MWERKRERVCGAGTQCNCVQKKYKKNKKRIVPVDEIDCHANIRMFSTAHFMNEEPSFKKNRVRKYFCAKGKLCKMLHRTHVMLEMLNKNFIYAVIDHMLLLLS